jgi:hypothetical protein
LGGKVKIIHTFPEWKQKVFDLWQPRVALVDLSWLMYRSYFSLNDLSYVANGEVYPSGHIYGTVKAVIQIQKMGYTVLLCVDSRTKRKINQEYKANRKEQIYNIFKDLNIILSICTYLPEVYYIKEEGYEADDIINSIVKTGIDPVIFSKDNDLIQSDLPFKFSNSLGPEDFNIVDRREYIQHKYKLDLSYLPVWHKVMRGDKSDNIPIAVYARGKMGGIIQSVILENKEHQSWELFELYLRANYSECLELINKIPEMKSNYDMVIPLWVPDEMINLKSMNYSIKQIEMLLGHTQMKSLKGAFKC